MLVKSQYIFNADKAMPELLYKTITVYLRKTQFLFLKCRKPSESLVLVKIKFIFTSGLKDQN